jgi:hypothetical protein
MTRQKREAVQTGQAGMTRHTREAGQTGMTRHTREAGQTGQEWKDSDKRDGQDIINIAGSLLEAAKIEPYCCTAHRSNLFLSFPGQENLTDEYLETLR